MFIVEFGSKQRGDYDECSDKDILVLAKDYGQVSNKKRALEELGYSVSLFSLTKAEYLISNGSLFFKHISDEGVLLSGDHTEYLSLISKWKHVTSNYQNEIDSNKQLLEILQYTPNNWQGVHVAIDLIVTSVRNILIRRLAVTGVHVFSWHGVLRTAASLGIINRNEVDLFLTARIIKNNYRREILTKNIQSFINDLFDSACKLFGLKRIVKFAPRYQISSLPERYPDFSYNQLRSLELLCAEYLDDPFVANFRPVVKMPNYFCAQSTHKSFNSDWLHRCIPTPSILN